MAADLFWSNVNTDPKRRYRFAVQINGQGEAVPIWTIKTATKPKANVSVVEHAYLDHVFKYPGRVTWDNVSMTLVDPAGKDQDMAYALMERLGLSGYKYPTKSDEAKISLSKKKATEAVGRVVIRQINADGQEVENWTLINPFIVSIDFGGLDYAADELAEVTLELAYDWAELNSATSAASRAPSFQKPTHLGTSG